MDFAFGSVFVLYEKSCIRHRQHPSVFVAAFYSAPSRHIQYLQSLLYFVYHIGAQNRSNESLKLSCLFFLFDLYSRSIKLILCSNLSIVCWFQLSILQVIIIQSHNPLFYFLNYLLGAW